MLTSSWDLHIYSILQIYIYIRCGTDASFYGGITWFDTHMYTIKKKMSCITIKRENVRTNKKKKSIEQNAWFTNLFHERGRHRNVAKTKCKNIGVVSREGQLHPLCKVGTFSTVWNSERSCVQRFSRSRNKGVKVCP